MGIEMYLVVQCPRCDAREGEMCQQRYGLYMVRPQQYAPHYPHAERRRQVDAVDKEECHG